MKNAGNEFSKFSEKDLKKIRMSLNSLIAQCYNNAIFRQDRMGLDWKRRLTIAGDKEFDETIIELSVYVP